METQDTQAQILEFLYQDVGYAKVKEIVEQGLPKKTTPKQYLKGTIIGSIFEASNPDRRDPESTNSYQWRRNHPTAPHIHLSSQLPTIQAEPGRYYLDPNRNFRDYNLLPDKIQERRYFFGNGNGFERYTSSEIREQFLEPLRQRFPGIDSSINTRGLLIAHLEIPDFYFYVSGANDRTSRRAIVCALNLPETEVHTINEIARRYNSHFQKLEFLKKHYAELRKKEK